MRYSTFILLLFLGACGDNSEKDVSNKDVNYSFRIMDKGDTVKLLRYGELKDYYVFAHKENLDSVIFSKRSQHKIEGDFQFGIIDNKKSINRYLIFKAPAGFKLENIKQPEDYFLDDEYKMKEYRTKVIEDYIDSEQPLSYFQLTAGIDVQNNDTLIFQETNFFQKAKSDTVVISIISYEERWIREEMHSILSDLTNKMRKK